MESAIFIEASYGADMLKGAKGRKICCYRSTSSDTLVTHLAALNFTFLGCEVKVGFTDPMSLLILMVHLGRKWDKQNDRILCK